MSVDNFLLVWIKILQKSLKSSPPILVCFTAVKPAYRVVRVVLQYPVQGSPPGVPPTAPLPRHRGPPPSRTTPGGLDSIPSRTASWALPDSIDGNSKVFHTVTMVTGIMWRWHRPCWQVHVCRWCTGCHCRLEAAYN